MPTLRYDIPQSKYPVTLSAQGWHFRFEQFLPMPSRNRRHTARRVPQQPFLSSTTSTAYIIIMVTTDPAQNPQEMRHRVAVPPGGTANVLEPTTDSNVSLLDMPGEISTDPLVHLPSNLENAQFRMDFPVSYIFVGAFSLSLVLHSGGR
jgi:hypothetical protein